MTDNTSDIRSGCRRRATPATPHRTPLPPAVPRLPGRPPPLRRAANRLRHLCCCWPWRWAARCRRSAASSWPPAKEVATRIDPLTRDLTQARQDVKQAAAALARAQTGQVSDLEDRIREVQSQNSALQQAWQSFSSGASDEILLNDVERSVTLASQLLAVAGDVSNAIVALETAQSRLARGRPPAHGKPAAKHQRRPRPPARGHHGRHPRAVHPAGAPGRAAQPRAPCWCPTRPRRNPRRNPPRTRRPRP